MATLTEERPDLIRRAAARLNTPPERMSTPDVPTRQPDNWIERSAEPESVPSQGKPRSSRTVNLSPTEMAANGIFLPSAGAGFVPTIEEFRLIKRHVLSNVSRGRATMGLMANRMLVTSACPGDGKTFTAINLALSLAFEHDRRVLLIDADAQRQSMRRYLGVNVDVGWIDLLTKEGLTLPDIMLSTSIPNLNLIPSGKLVPNMPELISSRAMSQFVTMLSEQDPDRLIIFDSLPCLVSNEPAILAESVGQVVFVIAADETKREEVQSALRLMTGCPNVGLVLNKGASALSETFGKYGYGYYKNHPVG